MWYTRTPKDEAFKQVCDNAVLEDDMDLLEVMMGEASNDEQVSYAKHCLEELA